MTMPQGFRASETGLLACPHRDVTCCADCAAAHEQIVEAAAVHYWIDDPSEREELRRLAAQLPVTPAVKAARAAARKPATEAPRRRKVVDILCRAQRRVRWFEHVTAAQRERLPPGTRMKGEHHRIVDRVGDCGVPLAEGREQAAGVCSNCAKGWESVRDDDDFNVFASPAEKARVAEAWRKAR